MSFWELLLSVSTIAAVQWLMDPSNVLDVGKWVGRRRRRRSAADTGDVSAVAASVQRAQLASRALRASPCRTFGVSMLVASFPGAGLWASSTRDLTAFVGVTLLTLAMGLVINRLLAPVFDALAAARSGLLTAEQARDALQPVPDLS